MVEEAAHQALMEVIMSLRDEGLRIDEALKEEYYEWKKEVSRLESVIEAQNVILRSDEAKGDRSENAVYSNAVETKQQSESTKRSFENRIKTYETNFNEYSTEKYEPEGKIKIGSVVSFDIVGTGKSFIVKIVPRKAGAPMKGAIQDDSPLGRELIGKSTGDTASCVTESGVYKYIIKEVY